MVCKLYLKKKLFKKKDQVPATLSPGIPPHAHPAQSQPCPFPVPAESAEHTSSAAQALLGFNDLCAQGWLAQ